MKIKTVFQLQDKLDKDLAWRKKELTWIKLNMSKYASKEEINTYLRIGTTFLYAHWEGFIKNAAENYLLYVSKQKLKYEDLTSNFLAIALRSKLMESGKSKKTSIHKGFLDFYYANLKKEAYIPYKNVIFTEYNLKSKILKEIIITLGLDYSPYELKGNYIDSNLVKNRNDIAHGRYIDIDLIDFENLYRDIISLLDIFKDQIIDAAKCRNFCCLS